MFTAWKRLEMHSTHVTMIKRYLERTVENISVNNNPKHPMLSINHHGIDNNFFRHIEYSPHIENGSNKINLIERVQRKFLRYANFILDIQRVRSWLHSTLDAFLADRRRMLGVKRPSGPYYLPLQTPVLPSFISCKLLNSQIVYSHAYLRPLMSPNSKAIT